MINIIYYVLDDEMEINEEHIQQIPTTTDYKYFGKCNTNALKNKNNN